jgi:DNA-binding SARP family transcriptional activator/nucleoid-associated protein YgaU
MTPPPSRRTRTAEVVRGLGALAVLVALVAGLPAALLTVAGSPLPHRLPSWDQITTTLTQPDTGNTLFLTVVKVIAWAAWCLFTLTVLTEIIAYRRGRPARRLPSAISPVQHLARDLIAMTALLISATAPTLSAATTASASSPHTTTAVTALPTPATAPTLHTQPASARRAEQPGHGKWRTRVIKRGDTLWAIARSATGSGTNYPALFKASTHLAQPHGLPPLTDPDRIYPGQHIKIPPRHDTADGPGQPPRQEPPSRHPHPPVAASPSVPTPRATAPATPPPPTATTPPTASRNPARPEPARPPASPPAATPDRSPAGPRTATSTPAPRADTTPPRTPPSNEPASGHHTPVTVTLPTGAYLGLGLAAAISIALAATRLHRRRRRATGLGWPDGSQPATPATIAKTRKAHLDTHAEPNGSPPTDAELVAQDASEPTPTHITAGTHETGELRVALSGLKLALTGPGATATARALATELLGRSRRDRAEVLIPEPDAAALLSGTGINLGDLARDVPGLNIVASLQAAITHLEAEFIHRARLMETSGEPDIHALRRAEPGEPLPILILIAQVPPASDTLDAILTFSAPYGLGAILLGTWTTATTVTVAADGTVTEARGPHADTWTGSRLFHLGPSEAAEMLHVIRTAHGAPEPPTEHPGTDAPTPPASDPAKPSAPPAPPAPASSRPGGSDGHDTARPVQLHVLGAIRLQADGQPISTGLRRITRDLLTYLALHPGGITRDQAVDALMPDRDLASGTTMIHTAINNARKTLRHATGLREAMFIIHTDGRYRLDAHLIDVDLWHLHTVLDRAHHAETDSGRINELRHIPDLYTAELAEDLTYEWAETERENLRRHATDALSQLAQLIRKTHPERAITALETAINHDPYAEPLYRDLMRIQAIASRPDAVRRTYDQLKRRLADLDTEPDDQTHQLLLTLLHPSTASRSAKTPPAAGRSAPRRLPAAPANGTGTVRPLRPRNPE